MSQASRSHARARLRWREQAARLIADATRGTWPICSRCGGVGKLRSPPVVVGNTATRTCDDCGGGGTRAHQLGRQILTGAPFDVALARGYGERLVAMADAQAVFEDWTRTQGLGPENSEPGAFGVECHDCEGSGEDEHRSLGSGGVTVKCKPCGGAGKARGGWPGTLARAYGWEPCKACRDKRDVVRCRDCNGRGLVRKRGIPPGFANGRSLARLGQRLLDALAGQPSECQTCKGKCLDPAKMAAMTVGEAVRLAKDYERLAKMNVRDGLEAEARILAVVCSDCRGTGHNLAGVLPPVESSPALRRKAERADPSLGRLHEFFSSMRDSAGEAERLRNIDPGPDRGIAFTFRGVP